LFLIAGLPPGPDEGMGGFMPIGKPIMGLGMPPMGITPSIIFGGIIMPIDINSPISISPIIY
jgi:hypothetical protein